MNDYKRKMLTATEGDPPARKIPDVKKTVRGKTSAGTERDASEHRTMDLTEITRHPTFEHVLPIDRDLLEAIIVDMRHNGFYPSQPVVLGYWPGLEGPVLIDGHARVQGAREAGMTHVPCVIEEFPNETTALQHAMSLQSKRRSTRDGALYRLAGRYDGLMETGRRPRTSDTCELPTRVGNFRGRSASAQITASLIACNYKKVEKIRKIRKDGTPEIQEAVKNDRISINRAYNLIRKVENGLKEDEEGPEKLSPGQVRALKAVLSEENFAGLKALGGDLRGMLNLAVEQFIGGFRNERRNAVAETVPRES